MILSEKLLNLIKLVSNLELKDEDKLKWQSAYLEIFEKGYFNISRDNLEKILSTHPIDSPFTTYGEIVLIKHIKRINIDNRQLKKTIEIAIRFLDGCLDVSNFTKEARSIVHAFRKIGLGVADFDNFCLQTNQEQLEAIQTIGEIISDTAYRTSENIGSIRGFVSDLEGSKSYNKGKAFSRFINKKTDVIIDGFSLKKLVIQGKAGWDEYSILPRRNSHVLLLPNQEIWFPYTDRVDGDSLPNSTQSDEFKYSIGELVTVRNPENEYYKKVLQILEVKLKQNKIMYTLRSQVPSQKIELEESEILEIELSSLLSQLNETKNTNNSKNIEVIGVILSSNDQKVLVDKETKKICSFLLPNTLTPEYDLINSVQNKYGINTEILDEIGSVITNDVVHLAYWLNIVGGDSQSLEWLDIDSIGVDEIYTRVFSKLNRKKKIYTQYEDIIRQLETEKTRILHDQAKAKSILVVHERPKQQLTLSERVNSLFGMRSKPKEYLRLNGGKNQTIESFDYDDSRYLLSLQQNILTDEFGTVKIIMEYSKDGVKSIQLYPEFFKSEERFLLDLYLELINMCLQNSVLKLELIKTLLKYERELVASPLVEVVKLIRQALNSSPDNFNDLSNKVY
ncbi:MAG: hypothetical protein ACRCXZ_01760 [Patescibacteria group bacterium]